MLRQLSGRRTLHRNPTEEALREVLTHIFEGEEQLLFSLELRWRLDTPADKCVTPTHPPLIPLQLYERYTSRKNNLLSEWTKIAERRIKATLAKPTPLRGLFEVRRTQ